MRTLDISRRDWLSTIFVCAMRPGLVAQELPGLYYRDYSKCLPDYLSALARAAYEKRNHELSTLTSQDAIQKRQQWAREIFWKLVGGQPDRTPLNARVTGKFEREGYSLQKVIYESQARVFVSANLYVPTAGKPPYPAVLFQMGHSALGKAYASYQKCCQGLARLGYVVLAFDPMGQGERIAYPDQSGVNTRLTSVDEEHNVPGKQFLLLGETASQYQVWDAIRSLDYLASHPLVDRARLGCTGQSGGGTLTMLLACVDSRLSAVVVCSGNTENVACANFNPPGSTDDAEQDFINSGRVGFDRWDLFYPFAPKPLLVLVSAHDFFGTYSPRYLSSGREEYEKLARVYETLGRKEQLGWRDTPLPHALTYSLRLDTYNWFERWLKHSDRRIEEEPPVAPEVPSTLWTGPTGSVFRDFRSLRPFDLIKTRAAAQRSRPISVARSTNILRLPTPPASLQFRTLARTPTEGAHIEAVEIRSTPGGWIPTWLFLPDKPDASRKPLLVLDDRGRNVQAWEGGLYHRTALAGRIVCAPDIRGIGDMLPEVGRGNPRYTIPHDSDEDFAWASLIFGDSLLAQRATDILAALQGLANRAEINKQPVAIAAKGYLAVPAIFAFAASPLPDSLYLTGGLVSYQNLLETEDYRQSLANFEWDIFRKTDLPSLAASAAPRRVHIAGAVDAAGNPMRADVVRQIYPGQNIEVSEQGAWDEAAFASL